MRLLLFAVIGVIVFFCALGLTIWLTGLSVAAGATLFAVGAFTGLAWLLGSIFSHLDAAESPVTTRHTTLTSSISNVTASKLNEIMTGLSGSRRWESLAETKSWFNSDCAQSMAIYTRKDNGTVGVRNLCYKHGKVRRGIDGEAQATDRPDVLTVSFFPGFVSQYVVRECSDNLLLVTNKDNTNGWLLHALDASTVTDSTINEWRAHLRGIVTGHHVDPETNNVHNPRVHDIQPFKKN